MGVQGLWQLLDPLGRPVTLEALENKVLAVDASLWIHQAVRGFRDRQSAAGGGPVRNAHLLGAFHRLCKLLFYRIKPVFVFDGSVPRLKRETVAARRERRADAEREAEKSRKEILAKHLKLIAIQEIMSEQTPSSSAVLPAGCGYEAANRDVAVGGCKSGKHGEQTDLYDLPPMPSTSNFSGEEEEKGGEEDDNEVADPREIPFHEAQFSSSYQNLEEIDLDSDEFEVLPLEIQHEILVELKETLKRKSWTRLSIMPEDPEEVGNHQIKQLLNRRRVQQKLDKVVKEMCKSVLTAGDLLSDLDYSSMGRKAEVRRIVSEDSTHYILLKSDIKKPVIGVPSSPSTSSVGRGKSVGMVAVSARTEDDQDSTPCTETNFHNSVASTSESSVDDSDDKRTTARLELVGEPDFLELSPSATVSLDEDTWLAGSSGDKLLFVGNCTEESLTKSNSDFEVETFAAELSQNQKKVVDDFAQAMTTESFTHSSQQLGLDVAVITADDDDDDDDDDDFVEVKPITDEMFPLELFQSKSGLAEPTFNSGNDGSDSKNYTVVDFMADESERDCPYPPNVNEDLTLLSKQLEDEITDLGKAKDRQERVAATITDEMYVEIQALLDLFGVPYLVSPSEAEAQCAVLDTLELTDGTITDDSDVWLFGAKRVYKNFFNHDRDLLFFKDSDVQQRLGLDRRKLIALALLTGSDYTDGVKGVGVVSALELLAEFGSGEPDDVDGIECLQRFREWWDKTRRQKLQASSNETKVRKALRSVVLHEGFPSHVVVNAYMEPTVDNSKVPFSWARPDLHELRQFAYNKLGWSKEKVDGVLLPVIKKRNEKSHQTHLSAYFQPIISLPTDSDGPFLHVNVGRRQHSRRLRRAIKRVRSSKECDDSSIGSTTSKLRSSRSNSPPRKVGETGASSPTVQRRKKSKAQLN